MLHVCQKHFIIILTFIVTALWDVILRVMSENYKKLPSYIQSYEFIKYLQPYFKKHTLLAAALIAGFVGALTQAIILSFLEFPKISNVESTGIFLIVSFVISGLFGFVMKWTKLFPHLEKTYYKNLGVFKSVIHDGVSGLIVQITLLLGLYMFPSLLLQ